MGSVAPSTSTDRLVDFTATGPITFSTPGISLPNGVIVLEPQTTPFTPPDHLLSNGCEPTAYCPVEGGEVRGGINCFMWDYVNGKNNRPFRDDCYPKGYAQLWWPASTWDELTQLAYPGTACIKGWTAACTRTFTETNTRFAQTICCPPGGYDCDLDDDDGAVRECRSLLATSTDLWVLLPSSEQTDGSLFERHTVTEEIQGFITLKKYGFPLQRYEPAATGQVTTPTGSSEPDGGSSGDEVVPLKLILGLALGLGLPALLVAACLWYILWVKARKKRSRMATELEKPQTESFGAWSPPPRQGDELLEMGEGAARVELPAKRQPVELTTIEKKVELEGQPWRHIGVGHPDGVAMGGGRAELP